MRKLRNRWKSDLEPTILDPQQGSWYQENYILGTKVEVLKTLQLVLMMRSVKILICLSH